jgi:hypothetical protein
VSNRVESSIDRWIGALVIAFVGYHIVVFAGLHLLVPMLDPVNSIITDYLDSPYAGLTRTTFAAFGLMWAAVAVGLWRALPRRPLSAAGVGLMALGVVSLALVTLRPEIGDPRNAAEVGSVLVRLAGIGRAALFLSLLVLSIAVRRDPRRHAAGTMLLGLAGTAILLLAITLATLLERGYAGLSQRIIFILLYAWAGIAAYAVIGNE